MGGGNGQKSKEARERNMAKKAKEQKQKNHADNKGKMAADKESIKCKICMTTFMVTANAKMLNDHFQSKHSSKGFTIEQCFPGVSIVA
uniref:At2g23090-like zinc-binding domain-containing protein n=1 Tax=Globisporangium ultimum (strain ATCC 200006 / CBS 805.95 / DAOM BR144) TaxID=431595 RepID=K3WAH4_GLOUD